MQSRPKALTNPFAPASIRIPMVPGRRRWAHTFPIGIKKFSYLFQKLFLNIKKVQIKSHGIFIIYVKWKVQ
jgi:hypothetical protein